ncbi:peptidase inhibitor family I36 protein [Amycolatopsis magusensis]
MFTTKRMAGSIAVTTMAAGLALAVTPAASAGARDGVCDKGEFCLYYGPNRTGSVSDFTGSIPDYGATQPTCYEYRGPGAGKGQCVKNNAVSAWNNTTKFRVTVYFNSNYGGISDTFLPGEYGNLIPAMQKENASHKFVAV